MSIPNKVNPVTTIILSALSDQVEEKSIVWLAQKREKILLSEKEMDFFMAFSQASRYFKSNPFKLSKEQIQEANALCEGLRMDLWSQLQAARVYLLLQYHAPNLDSWLSTLQKLFETGDMLEIEALYSALPLMPLHQPVAYQASLAYLHRLCIRCAAAAAPDPQTGPKGC